MAAEMQRELDATRTELRRGILELPQETAESASQMRRVIVDQIEALAELNRIVARHGRGMDAQQSDPARRAHPEESVVVSMGGGRGPRPVARGGDDIGMAGGMTRSMPAPMPTPPPAPPPMQGSPASFAPPRRSDAPSLSPSQGPGNGNGGPGPGGRNSGNWMTDLLNRASQPEVPRPDDRIGRTDGGRNNPLGSIESLSADIARMVDPAAVAEFWDSYPRGDRNTKRLYTAQGQKTFDEIARRYRGDRDFKQNVDRYIAEFERLLDDVSRRDGQVAMRAYLTSETGKVYTMLAQAAGRFD
jgi:hypothetical protein